LIIIVTSDRRVLLVLAQYLDIPPILFDLPEQFLFFFEKLGTLFGTNSVIVMVMVIRNFE